MQKSKQNKGGRPSLGKSKRPQHSITFLPDHDARIKKIQSKHPSVSRSYVVEAALEAYFKDHPKFTERKDR